MSDLNTGHIDWLCEIIKNQAEEIKTLRAQLVAERERYEYLVDGLFNLECFRQK